MIEVIDYTNTKVTKLTHWIYFLYIFSFSVKFIDNVFTIKLYLQMSLNVNLYLRRGLLQNMAPDDRYGTEVPIVFNIQLSYLLRNRRFFTRTANYNIKEIIPFPLSRRRNPGSQRNNGLPSPLHNPTQTSPV